MTKSLTLAEYGWTAHFQSQLSLDEITSAAPARVVAVHRNALETEGPGFTGRLPPIAEDEPATVGDWLLLDQQGRMLRRLDRFSAFKRRAAGAEARIQLIAANVDTLFVISSCNADFNVARIERYLALAREARVTPVLVLTKSDLAPDAAAFAAEGRRILTGLAAETLDARAEGARETLAPWLARGQTIALLGSSGVGKSTLLNTLCGAEINRAQGIREHDARGRHTTTARSLHRLPSGAWLLDSPGMRELQLVDVEGGIRDVFADIEELARACRFADCRHETEPGCAVRAAAEAGLIDEGRLKRRAKLLREEARNTEALWERRARERSFGRMVERSLREKRRRKEKT